MDLAVLKNFPVAESRRLEFRWEMFNLINHANFSGPTASLFSSATAVNPSATRSQITGTRTSARQMQFALKFIF
jgi:hypothetical protein